MSTGETSAPAAPHIESISAVTLATHDMARAVRFYLALGFSIRYGGASAAFTSFHAGKGYLNLIAARKDQRWSWWGRAIFYVSDVDGMYHRAAPAIDEGRDAVARLLPGIRDALGIH